MGENGKVLRLSATLTLIILAFILIVIGWIGNVFAYGTQSGTLLDLRRGSRITDFMFIQPFEDKATLYFGTQSVTGSGSAGYIAGSSTAFPRMEYNANTLKFNFIGAGLQNEGSDVGLASSMDSYILINAGTGTDNAFANPTLTGVGTLTATFRANGVDISDTEISYLDGVSSNIQNQIDVDIQGKIDTATGSISAHTHTGADGTAQISHNSITGTGTNSHSTIDSFIGSKAQANGLASLDSGSLVIQNPANATATPTASKILIADGSGKIADGWLNSTITALGQTIELGTETTGNTDNVAEGSSNLYYLDSRVNAAVGSLSVNALNDVNIAFNENDFIKIVGGQLVAGSSSATVAFSAVTGSASASQLPLISGLLGSATYAQLPTVIRLTGTTTSPEAGAFGQLYVQSSSSGGGGSGNDEYTKLLLHMDNPGTTAFVDSSGSSHTITANGDAIGTTTAKFGSGAGYFDGTGDYLTIADHDDFFFDTNDFTIDFWVNLSNLSAAYQCFYEQYTDTSNKIVFYRANDSSELFLRVVSGGAVKALYQCDWTPSLSTWYHLELVRNGTSVYIFIDGVSQSLTVTTAISTNSMPNLAANPSIGRLQETGAFMAGKIDEFRISNTARHTSGFTPETQPYIVENYTQYSAKYADPVNGNTVFEILTPGTATTLASYIYNNATTTVWGLGTNTAVTGTTSGAYAGWTNRPIRVSAVDIASTKKTKENIMPIRIKPEQLEAESKAKPVYVAEKKPAWFAANETNYTYVGSNTVTYIDTAAMESAYASYIELEWASDLNQSVYIDAVQKAQQKYFWGLFDKIQPKSWNPIDNLKMTRKGLVVEEVPDEIKGADGQSIDQMAVVTYQTLVLQDLKDSIVDIMQALKDLSAAGTFTTKSIDDRLEVMRIVQ